MARQSLTTQVTGNLGALGYESGTWTDGGGGGGYSIFTRLGRLVWVSVRSVDGVDTAAIYSLNSATASDTEDDAGEFFISADLNASDIYGYEAIGYGR